MAHRNSKESTLLWSPTLLSWFYANARFGFDRWTDAVRLPKSHRLSGAVIGWVRTCKNLVILVLLCYMSSAPDDELVADG